MIFNNHYELLKEAESLGMIEIKSWTDPIPVIKIKNLNVFKSFLQDIAEKTDCDGEKQFCESNLEMLEFEDEEDEEEFEEKVDDFKKKLKSAWTLDDILKTME